MIEFYSTLLVVINIMLIYHLFRFHKWLEVRNKLLEEESIWMRTHMIINNNKDLFKRYKAMLKDDFFWNIKMCMTVNIEEFYENRSAVYEYYKIKKESE